MYIYHKNIKLILLDIKILYVTILDDDNSNNIFVEADRDMLTQLIYNNTN
jgi:hypothetical protein